MTTSDMERGVSYWKEIRRKLSELDKFKFSFKQYDPSAALEVGTRGDATLWERDGEQKVKAIADNITFARFLVISAWLGFHKTGDPTIYASYTSPR